MFNTKNITENIHYVYNFIGLELLLHIINAKKQLMSSIYKSIILFIISIFLFASKANASHIRAGEIIATKVGSSGSNTYKFTLFIYRNSNVSADENSAVLYLGDGNTVTSPLITRTQLNSSTQQLKFEFTHTYTNSGKYTVFTYIKYRNVGVKNIPNSGGTSFYIETQILIDPFLGTNSTPALKIPPIDRGAVGQVFIHNPGSFDADGDSLVYQLIPSKDFPDGSTTGKDILGFKPVNDASFNLGNCVSDIKIDSKTGTITWDRPCSEGEYNVAFIVKEYRNGVQIGYLTRDMQIEIIESTNTKPNLTVPSDTCVAAGQSLRGTITGTDLESNQVEMSYFSGPFELATNRATVLPTGNPNLLPKPARLFFNWQTTCEHIRDQPYIPIFKVDDKDTFVPLVDIKSWSIQVNGPAITGLVAVPSNDSIKLSWDRYLCRNSKNPEYHIMRKTCDDTPIIVDSCSKGNKGINGFEEIGILTQSGQSSFVDTNVAHGRKYCYYVFARHTDVGGGESKPSGMSCSQLRNDISFMMNVSVTSTSVSAGSIKVRWKKPQNIDPILNPPPYSYQVLRREVNGTHQVITTISSLSDTSFTDVGLNTLEKQYFYKVAFRFGASNTLKHTTVEASSVFLQAISKNRKITLTWRTTQTPWQNSYPTSIYKLTTTSGFVLIGTTTSTNFDDVGQNTEPLVNGNKYTYYVRTNGRFEIGCPNIPSTILVLDTLKNTSQVVIDVIPKDSVPPCPPELKINPIDCEISKSKIELSWKVLLDIDCENTIVGTKLFFAETQNAADYRQIADLKSPDSTFIDANSRFFGCYRVKTYRFLENGNLIESGFSNTVCVDVSACESFEFFDLPNVFTPDPKDGFNDVFEPKKPTRLVKTVSTTIYNRWGTKVFSGNDININWDGAGQPEGIYYFVVDIEFDVLDPAKQRQSRKGWVQILR